MARSLRRRGGADRPGAAARGPPATGGCRSPRPTSPPPARWWPRRAQPGAAGDDLGADQRAGAHGDAPAGAHPRPQIGLRPQRRLWERSSLLATLADPAVGSQIGYVRWQQDFPDGADWFPQLLAGGAVQAGANRNYALLADPKLDRLIDAGRGGVGPGRARRALGPGGPRRRGRGRPGRPSPTACASTSCRAAWATTSRSPVYGFLWMRAQLPNTN